MNIKEIYEKYKSKTLDCKLKEIENVDSEEFRGNLLEEENFMLTLDFKSYSLEMGKQSEIDFKKNKFYYTHELESVFYSKNAWNKFELEGGFKKEDFETKKLNGCSESEKTERLLFLLRNYNKIIEDEKNRMLSFSAMHLEGDSEESTVENKKQGIQARYEIYKYLTENESKDEIPKIYKEFMENTGNGSIYLLDMLENKKFDKFLNKQNEFYREKIAELRDSMSQEDIDKLISFFKETSKKFGFSYKSMITDIVTYMNYSEELKRAKELEEIYGDILQEEIKEEQEKKKQKELEEAKKKEEKEKQKEEQNKKVEAKRKNKIDFDDGNIDEYLEYLKNNSISDEEKENIRILFIHWVFHRGKSLESILNKEKRDILFDRIKQISQKADKKLSIFICSDEEEENLRKIMKSFNDKLKDYEIENVVIEGATGEHGRFMIDSNGKRFEMYNMPKDTFDKIRKVHNDLWENMDEYLDSENQSFMQYNLPCSNKNGERLSDYLIAFRRYFFGARKDIRYYQTGKNGMLVLTKQQFQETVIDKVLKYYKEKYNFSDKDIINNLVKENEKEIGDEQDK